MHIYAIGDLHLSGEPASKPMEVFGEHWRNVETAMKLLQAERIDHGYTIIDNPTLVKEARDAGMIFAVVPTNSYYLNFPAEGALKPRI